MNLQRLTFGLKGVDLITFQAWENTYKKWDSLHSHLLSIGGAKQDKTKSDKLGSCDVTDTAAAVIINYHHGSYLQGDRMQTGGGDGVPRQVRRLEQLFSTE